MSLPYRERLFIEPARSYFLFGPRGTGKSTMVAHRHPSALLIDLRIPEERLRYSTNPDAFKNLVLSQPRGHIIVIDEIQKVPDLLSLVHVLIERKRDWKFILTGSSARSLRRQGVDLLGGRALKKILHPFMACELKDDFNFEEALSYGLLPLRFVHKDSLEFLKGYISLYIEEEVKVEGLVRNIEPFARFLEAMSFAHGGILNVSNIAKECQVKRTTVTSWISIIEDLLMGYQITVFEQRAKRELSAHPKFYFFDVGVYRALRPRSLLDSDSEINGAGLEGLVAQHLVAWRDYSAGKHTINFWRTRSGTEVDFVIHGSLGFWAIEVKNSTKVRPEDIRPLVTFLEDYPEARAFLLYRGTERQFIKNILCLPCEEFLKEIRPDVPLDESFVYVWQ